MIFQAYLLDKGFVETSIHLILLMIARYGLVEVLFVAKEVLGRC